MSAAGPMSQLEVDEMRLRLQDAEADVKVSEMAGILQT